VGDRVDATAVDLALASRLPLDPPDGTGYGYESVVRFWDQLNFEEIIELADVVSRDFSEHYRDTNRNAADHAFVKYRIAEQLGSEEDRAEVLQ